MQNFAPVDVNSSDASHLARFPRYHLDELLFRRSSRSGIFQSYEEGEEEVEEEEEEEGGRPARSQHHP